MHGSYTQNPFQIGCADGILPSNPCFLTVSAVNAQTY